MLDECFSWLLRFLDAYGDGALGLDDLKHWRDINLPLLESADSDEAVSLEDVWRQLEDLFDQPPLPGVRPPAFAQQVRPYTLACARC